MDMNKILTVAVMAVVAMAASVQAQVCAYIIDGSGTATNIRAGAGGKVVATVPNNGDEGYVVTLKSVKDGWWRIEPEIDVYGDNERLIELSGSNTGYWVHHSVLELGIVGDPTNSLRSKPSRKSKVVKIPDSCELSFRPIELSGKWLKVKSVDGKVTGWLHSDRICFNPLTTCP